MSEPVKGVFLSYAREDSPAVQRIADGLRAVGVEVWFDQAELRGGDAWDHKIRSQIRDCTLFLPVISATTQGRGEGYFRREWKLGSERTHDMAAGVPFIMPVVIDATREDEAAVPEEFMRVQWSRLPGGAPTPGFISQVLRMLEAPRLGTAFGRSSTSSAPHAAPPPIPAVAAPAKKSGPSLLTWIVVGFLLLCLGYCVFRPRRDPQDLAKIIQTAQAMAEKVEKAEKAKEAKVTKPETVPVSAEVPAIDPKSVAVLPFENMSEEKDANAFFADGVHEDLLTNLSFIRDLRVVSRTSVMQYRGTTKSIRQIAQELGVAYILEGSVRRAGSKVRVTGQLIKAATDEHVWAKSYDRDITDVFAIQSELAQAIAGALQAAISPSEKTLLDRKPTENTRAYELFVKVRNGYQNSGLVDYNKAESELLEAVQLDPGFAEAWAILAAMHASQRFNEVDATSDRMDKARSAIETAVRLAPDDPVVIEFHGDYFYYGFRDYAHAAEQYRRLLELRPNSADAYGSLGLIYRRQGRWSDCLTNLRKAVELDPRNLRYRSSLISHLSAMRQYDEAEKEGRAALALIPDDLGLLGSMLSISFARTGSLREIVDWARQYHPKPEDEPAFIEIRKQIARIDGNYAEALRIDLAEPPIPGTPKWQTDFTIANDMLGAGDEAGARKRLTELLPELRDQLKQQPANSQLWTLLGQAEAVLGQRDAALAAAAKLRELLPESTDAVGGPPQSRSRAIILLWAGEKDEALAEFGRLLQVPYGTDVHGDPMDVAWRPLRDDPRFQALLKDPKNNAPIEAR
ncbi:MAG TPA: TIR domain-containing protein [Candidatus Didemnitutus sp.]|nr:TIR domain-containing protein [Candidatus Didemnitutus sp.]